MGHRTDLDGWGKSDPSGIRSPDSPSRSESLYRLSFPGPPFASTLVDGKCSPSCPGSITSRRKTSLPISWEVRMLWRKANLLPLPGVDTALLCQQALSYVTTDVAVCRYKVWCADQLRATCGPPSIKRTPNKQKY